MGAVGERGPCTKRDGNEGRFRQLLLARARRQRGRAVDLNAVGALGRERDRDRYQFLVFFGIAPSPSAATSSARNPAIARGASACSSVSFFNFPISYMVVPFN
jgi:hypothetical protein